MKTIIATDTAADLLPKQIEENDITLIDLPVCFDGEPCTANDTFWNKLLDGGVSHTSQPNPDTLRRLFTQVQADGGCLIYVALSSKLSATYENALAIKEALGCDRVLVLDSLNATYGEGLLALHACSLRDRGASPQQIVTELEGLKSRVRVYACVDTLKYLSRGGRISKTTATIGTLLNVKPLIEVTNGEVVPYSKTLGNRIAIHKLTERLRADNIDTNFAPVPIYAYDSKNCENFIDHANAQGLHIDKSLLTPIGPTIGTHIGPYAFGIVFVATDR